jgi:hypothetical protein
MWEKAARRRARQLFVGACALYTAILTYAFARYTADTSPRMRDGTDWLLTLAYFTPMFGAMHLLVLCAYSGAVSARTLEKKTSAQWFASHTVSMSHALVVTGFSLASLFLFWDAPAPIKLGTRMPPAGAHWVEGYPLVSAVGELFTSFLLYDLVAVACAWDVLGSAETIAHHAGFLLASLVLRGFSFAPWSATVCLCMEASTPFLNVCQLKEALGLSKSSALVVGSFSCFALNFFVFRIVLLAGALAQLILHWDDGPWAEPPLLTRAEQRVAGSVPAVPPWAPYVLLALLCSALGLMLVWFRRIVGILLPSAATRGATQLASGEEEADALADRPRPQQQLSDDEGQALVSV